VTDIDVTGRAAAEDLRRQTVPDVDATLARIPGLARRRRRVRVVAASVLVSAAVAIGALAVQPSADDATKQLPASPSPSVPSHRVYADGLLPPLCQASVDAAVTSTASAAPCPPRVQSGDNTGMIVGLNYARRFHVTVAGTGWQARSVGRFLGVELTTANGSGVTVFPYPAVVGHPGSIGGWRRIDSQLRARGDVVVSPWTAVELGRVRFHQADLAVADGATLSQHCRLVAPCLRVMTTVIPEPGLDVVELQPGVTSRVLVQDAGGGSVGAGVWVHDVTGAGAPAALGVLATLRIAPATLPSAPE